MSAGAMSAGSTSSRRARGDSRVLLKGSPGKSWIGWSGGSARGGDGGTRWSHGGTGGLQIGDEPGEQPGELAGLGLVPAGEGGERPVRADGAGGREGLGAGRGEP